MDYIDLVIVFILGAVAISYFYGKNKQRNDTKKHIEKKSKDYDEYLEKSEHNNNILNENENKLSKLQDKINKIIELRKKRSDEIIESFKNGILKGNPSTILEEDKILNDLRKEEKKLFENFKKYIKKNNSNLKKY